MYVIIQYTFYFKILVLILRSDKKCKPTKYHTSMRAYFKAPNPISGISSGPCLPYTYFVLFLTYEIDYASLSAVNSLF